MNEVIIEAGESAMMCLYTKDHADGLNRLHKIKFLDKVASNQVYIKS